MYRYSHLSSGRAQYDQSIGRLHNERIVSLSRFEITSERQVFLPLWNDKNEHTVPSNWVRSGLWGGNGFDL